MNGKLINSKIMAHKKPGTEAGIPGPGSNLEGRDSGPIRVAGRGHGLAAPCGWGGKGRQTSAPGREHFGRAGRGTMRSFEELAGVAYMPGGCSDPTHTS